MSNLIKYFCVFSFFLVCNSRLIKGQQAIDYSNNSILSISSQLEVFEDEESFFTVVDLINGNIEFEKTSQSTPSYSFTQSTIWSRFKINNLTDDDCYLEISPPILNQVILYQVFDFIVF